MKIDINGTALAAAAASLGAAVLLTAPSALADPEPPPPPPTQEAPIQPVAGDAVPQPEGVPHLTSPDNPPPGTSAVPVGPQQGRGTSYLRDLWHALRTQEFSGRDALLLLTQRRLDPNAPPGTQAGPQPQLDPNLGPPPGMPLPAP